MRGASVCSNCDGAVWEMESRDLHGDRERNGREGKGRQAAEDVASAVLVRPRLSERGKRPRATAAPSPLRPARQAQG